MSRQWKGAFRILILGVVGGPAHAVEIIGTGVLADSSLQVVNDFEIRYHHVPDKLIGFEDRNIHDYVEEVNRLNLLLTKPGLSIGMQVDEVAFFANQYTLDGELYHSWDLYDSTEIISPWTDAYVTLEKAYYQRRGTWGEVTLGDAYASFGRGMALNIVRNTDIDVDTSIRGAKLIFRGGDMESTFVSGLSNTQQVSQDNPNQLIGIDVAHMITGGRLVHYGVGPAQVGLHGVVYRFGREGDDELHDMMRYQGPLDAVVSGFSVELPDLLGVDLYGEGDLYSYQTIELSGSEESSLGSAFYGSASAYPGKTTFLVEAKRTRDTERLNAFVTPEGWEVATVPTLEYERVITEDGSAAVNSNHLDGGRIRVDYAVKPGSLVPYLSVAAFRDEGTGGLHFNKSPETIGHAVGGVQYFWGQSILQVNAGHRVDLRDDPAEGGDVLSHLDSELHVPLFGEESLEIAIGAKQFQWGFNDQEQEDFIEMENALVWHHGHKVQLVLYQDYSDNPLVTSEGNISEDVYGAMELVYKPTTASKIRAFYGAYKAGIRCSGGQCRTLPGFEGGRLAYETTF